MYNFDKILLVPSVSGLSNGYSGINSRKVENISRVFVSVNLANTWNGERPLPLAASASILDSDWWIYGIQIPRYLQ